MNNLNTNFYDPLFHHIYVEKKAYEYPMTKQILAKYENTSQIILINHYKDIFNRRSQNFHEQKQAQSLILAVKEGTSVYQGAPVCQSFGNDHFYYTSSMMNCIYDCEYCYLQGMYPSAHIVVFVNIEDIFREVKKLLEKHPVYLCISYDTDLLAFEQVFHIVHKWVDFLSENSNLTIELRTKSANLSSILDIIPNQRFILAWTVSPSSIADSYEHKAPSLTVRLNNIKRAMDHGYTVRLCFDPMLYTKDWKEEYLNLIDTISSIIDLSKLYDVSLGVFRISADYMTNMRKQRPDSSIVNYPYENDHGVFHISTNRSKEMIQTMKTKLLNYLSNEQIFVWEEN